MLELVELMPTKKSLHLAQKEMDYRKMDDIMKTFAKLDLSPVCLSKRQTEKFLPNIYTFLITAICRNAFRCVPYVF